jgi:hypothetical protein
LWRRWPTSLAIGLALAIAVALPVAVTLVEAATAEAGLQDAARRLGPSANLRVQWSQISDPQLYSFIRFLTPRNVGNSLGPLMRPGAVALHSDRLQVGGTGGRQAKSTARLAALEDLERHARWVQGQLPAEALTGSVWNVTAPEGALRTLGVQLGQVTCLYTLSDRPVEAACVRLVGVWRALSASDPYWAGLPLPDDVLTVDSDELFAFVRQVRQVPQAGPYSAVATFYFEPDLARINQADVNQLVPGFRKLRAAIPFRTSTILVETDLDTAIQTFEDRLGLATFAVQLMAAQVLLVALLAVALIAGHSLDRQRMLFATWRSRGWTWLAIWRLVMVETLALAVVAVPAGVAVGWVASLAAMRVAYGSVPLLSGDTSLQRMLPAAGLGLVAALAAVALQAFAASRRELLEVRRESSRPAHRAWWQWRYLDVGLAALALPLLAASRLFGLGQVRATGAGGDPFSLLLPGLALVLVGVALLRLLPLAGALSGAMGRGLAATLAAVQLRRRPVQHAGLALVMVLTVALGVFASVYASTAPRAAADRAAYSVGSDLRFHMDGDRPPLDQVVAGLSGVRAASFVLRSSAASAIGSPFQPGILAVDPNTFSRVLWSRPDLADQPLSSLVQLLADRDRSGLPLPGRPDRLALWSYSSGFAGRLSAELVDSAGRPGRAALGTLDLSGWRHLEGEIVWPAGAVRYPIRLRHLVVEPAAATAVLPADGSIGLSELAAGQPGMTGEQVVDRFPLDDQGVAAWWSAPGQLYPSSGGFGLKGRPHASPDGSAAILLDYRAVEGRVLVGPKPGLTPIPALAPATTLAKLGIRVGEAFSLITNSAMATFEVVGVVGHFPTFYPEAEDFLVVAQAPLLDAMSYAHAAAWPAEAWLTVTTGSEAADRAALLGRADVTFADSRRLAEEEARQDPLLLELRANLAVGFGAAVALALVAAALHFLVAVHSRHSEYAILRANGLGRALIARSLALEQVLLVGFGVAAGTALGLALAWALVPALQLGDLLVYTVPAPVLTVDPALTGLAVAGAALLALAGGGLASRAGGRLRLTDELRAMG